MSLLQITKEAHKAQNSWFAREAQSTITKEENCCFNQKKRTSLTVRTLPEVITAAFNLRIRRARALMLRAVAAALCRRKSSTNPCRHLSSNRNLDDQIKAEARRSADPLRAANELEMEWKKEMASNLGAAEGKLLSAFGMMKEEKFKAGLAQQVIAAAMLPPLHSLLLYPLQLSARCNLG